MANGDDNRLMIKIDAYLKGHLSEEESTAFAQEIAANTALSEQVDRQKRHLEALELLLEADLRAKMKQWASEEDEPRPTNTWKPWGLGLVVVAVLTGLFFLFQPKNKVENPSNHELNHQDSLNNEKDKTLKNNIDTGQTKPNPTIQPPKTTPSVSNPEKPIAVVKTLPNDLLATANDDLAMVLTELESNSIRRDTQSNILMSESHRLIRQKEYTKAVNMLKNVSHTEGVFTRAIAYFLNKQYTQALPIFESLTNKKGFDRLETAEYYAALCLLANGQKQEAVKRLSNIANDKGHQYSSKAKTELKRLGYRYRGIIIEQ